MTWAAAQQPNGPARAPSAPVPAASGPAASAAKPAPAGLISIGEVLAQLREDFPDVTISKLRFLESEGLVEPQRTPAGYRKYSAADVARLRYVLAAQRDRFLPLRVIRDQLAALDRGEDVTRAPSTLAPPVPGARTPAARTGGESDPVTDLAPPVSSTPSAGHDDRPPTFGAPGTRTRFSREEVLERSGLTGPMLAELEATGLLGTRTPGWYDGDALVVAQVAGAFARFGLAPRHLRAYRAGADREVGMFAQLLTPLQRSMTPVGRARAAAAMQELTDLSQQLHAALVRIGLRDTLRP